MLHLPTQYLRDRWTAQLRLHQTTLISEMGFASEVDSIYSPKAYSRKEVAAMDDIRLNTHSVLKYQHLQTTSGNKPA